MFGINVVTFVILSALGKHTCEMATFKVDKVKKSTTPLQRAHLGKLLETRMGGAKPESHFKPESERPIVETYGSNAFVSAVHTAYSSHYPLVLSPDHIWMCIAQGLSQHVNANPEKLRKMFVEHEGKKTLLVRRDDFIKGSPDNPWPEVFDEFSEQIREHVGEKTHDLLTPDFTTTGQNERAAAQIVLMDTFKEYFEYLVRTTCGIPEITLEGTVEDWKKIRERAVGLAQYDLDWWINALKPILDQFVNAASGKVDKTFWSTIYKQEGGSGGPYITGWIITLFPYCSRPRSGPSRNPYLENWNDESMFGGMTSDMFPPGIVSTSFKWEYYGVVIPMHFYAGFMAVSQDPNSLSLRPVIGWAVVDDKKGMSSNESMISSSSLNKTEGNNSNVILKVAPSVGLVSSKKRMICSSSMKKTKGNNIWKVAPSVALVSSKESMISSSIWKVASTIALAESVVGMISNSLLLLLIYSNPLNNLCREASWITITNLAAADLLTSILTIPFCHPVFQLSLRHASEMQYLSTEVLLHIGYAGSFFLLMLFAIERYIAIKHPTESGNILTKKRVFLACLLCWAAAIGCALPIISKSAGFLIAFYGILELSVLVMILFQVLIIRSIKEASRHLEDGSKGKAHMKDISTTIVILILVLMVTAFPYFIAKQAEYFYCNHPHLFTEMAHLFPYYYFPVACLNFIVNPFIYAWCLPDYRNAFKELLNRKLLYRETRAQRNFHRFSSQIISQKETITMTSC